MLRRIKAGYDWLEDGIERTLWLKLTRLALWTATIITMIIKALDSTIHSLDAFGHWWLIGGGIFVYLLLAVEEIRSRQPAHAEVCLGCGHPVAVHPHQDPDLAGLACNQWYAETDR